MPGREAHYVKIGIFFLATFFLLFSGILLLGSGVIFQPESFEFESYFDTSVEGLAVGSPVKFRGVQIGSVSAIDFASNYYESRSNKPISAVLLRSRVATKHLPKTLAKSLSGAKTREERLEIFGALVKRGLRVRITTAGIAGVTYLDLDYHPPEHCPVPALEWEPEIDYVPAIPGLASHLTESLESTLDSLARVPFDKLGKDLDDLLIALGEEVARLELDPLAREAQALLEELRATNASFRDLLDSAALRQLPDEVAALVAEARKVVNEAERPLRELLDTVARAGGKVESLAAALEAKLPEAADDVQSGAAQARLALGSFRDYVQQLDERTDEILADLEVVSENLKAATEDMRGNPSRALFGEPPPDREEQ